MVMAVGYQRNDGCKCATVNYARVTYFLMCGVPREKKVIKEGNRGKGRTCRCWSSINFAYERGSEGGEDESAGKRGGYRRGRS
jgi:hypothetical protein